MRLVHTLFVVVVATALVAGTTAYAGSREATVQRQRIAFEMVMNDLDSGVFTVNPLTPGSVKSDKGTVAMGGFGFGTYVRNGMKVTGWVIRPTLNGRRGTVHLAQRFDTNEMQNGVRVGVGTWKIANGTGEYSSIKGGGRYVSFARPDGRTLVRQEGWVTNSG